MNSLNKIDMKQLKIAISKWVGNMYRSIADYNYQKFSTKIFNE